MKITYQWITCLILLAVGSLSSPSMAEHRWVGFSELVHRAQVIFDGRVIEQVSWESDDGKMILTDVTFDLIDLVHADPQALAFIGDTITITMPGGTFGGRSLNVCTTPHLNHGERVLLCAYLDGKKHISPVVGGEQGVFRIMERGRQLEPIPTKGHAFGLLGIQGEHLHISPRIERIEGNEGVFSPPPRLAPMARSLDHNPEPVATVLRGRSELMTLRELKTAMQKRLEITFDARAATDTPAPQRLQIPAGKELTLADRDADDPPAVSPICVCGDHHFGALYEIPPVGSVNRDDERYAMSHWHRFVNNLLWNEKDMDDPCGINFENEIGVFADGDLAWDCWWKDWENDFAYGSGEPSLAVCFSWTALGGCDQELVEADTIYNTQHHWSPGYDRNEYRGTALHELGHSWGYIRDECAETYQYDQLTVMGHRSTRETNNGIHAADAYYIRAVYDYYLGPFGDVADIGCESYVYIEGNSYGDLCDQCQFPLEPGDEFTIKNILVESMSSAPVPATLYFVASEDEHLDWNEDIIIGTFGFDELPPFSSVNGDYTMSIPDYLPPGTHNLLIHVALYDFIDNDRNPENNTSLARLPLTIINNSASNDNCSSPQTITEGRWLVDNRWADTDGGTLPSCDDEFMYPMWHDVWYSYQSDCGGILELDTCTGQGFNTIIALYEDTGECPPDPNSMIACSNDSDLCTDYRSYLFTEIKGNTPYRIRVGTPFPEDVGSPGGSMGQAVLNVNLYPGTLDGTPNDECVGAIQVDKGAHDFSTSCATNQDIMDPGLCTADGVIHNDLWYSFTASCSGTARLTAFSQQFDAAIAVYDPGFACVNNVNALLGSACAVADDPSAKVMLEVIAGQELLIRVGGQNPDDRGGASLQIGLIKRAPNDTSEEAILIEGDIVLDTTCALSEGMFHAGCSPIQNDVWYRYVAEIDGDLQLNACELVDFDIEMAVYIDNEIHPPGDQQLYTCTNQLNPCSMGTDFLTTRVLEGNSYLVRIGGADFESMGTGVVKVILTADTCLGDVTSADGSSGIVDITDMLAILGDWGQMDSPHDIDGDRIITIADLLIVLDGWGPCPVGCNDPFRCEDEQDIFDHICGGDGKTSLCACMHALGLDGTCIDVTDLLSGYPCDELQTCIGFEGDCPPGHECVNIECCDEWEYFCLPVCPTR